MYYVKFQKTALNFVQALLRVTQKRVEFGNKQNAFNRYKPV